jgi:hypothetical protein
MTLAEAIRRAGRPLWMAHLLRRLAPGLAVACSALAVAAWMARLGWGGAAAWVALAWLVVLLALVTVAWRARRRARDLAPAGIAARLEAAGAWRFGALTTLLDPLAAGTSPALHEAATRQETARVSAEAGHVLGGAVDLERRQTARVLGWAGVAVLALVMARPLEGAGAMLWRPWQAVRALVAPVRLSADTTIVDRGQRVRLQIEALGQRRAVLLTRAPGESWREQAVELDPTGHATIETAPLVAELVARVTAAGRSSREVRVAVRLPAFLGTFGVTARYPRYLALEDELLPVEGDTLVIPEGTELAIRGRATTALDRAVLQGVGGPVALSVTADAFAGTFTPVRDGEWQLEVTAAQGGDLEGMPPPIRIRVVADSAPIVTIPVPGSDTMAPPSHRVPVVVAIEDDHGLRGAALEVRRGSSGSVQRLPLALGPEPGDRALLSLALDLDSLGLRPGDTLRYLAVASDNAPRPRTGRSREYLVVLPTEAEQRAARAEATSEAGSALDSLAALARRAQRQAEDLARERARGETGRGADPGQPISSEAARRAEQAAETQQDVERQLEAMRRDLAELEQAAGAEGLADSALARQLGEIRELLDRALTPELRDAMERLRESLQDLDAERTREALRDLAAQQERMRQAIERARELFERAALETELANLAQEAKELLERQQAARQQLEADSLAGARTEEQLAERADSLAAALDRAAGEMSAESTREGLEQNAQQAREAAEAMRNAAESARSGRRPQARQQAEAAGEALEPLERQIRENREAMQEEMQQEVLDALDRLLAETSRLLARQYAVAESFRRGAIAGSLRAEESMLEEATAKLLQQVIAVSGKNALISPRISVALAGARDGMRAAIEATSAASPSLGLAADRAGEAVDMLSLAAYSLLMSRESVDNAQSGSGLEEAMQQMQQMAGQQGELSDQGQSMLQQGMQQDMAMMMQMAMQQRAIAQQLERMRAQGQMPGAGELGEEASELARALEAGRLNPETIERQQRLFRRMLDAGRSLQGEEEDERRERQSETGRDGETAIPDALDPRLLRGNEFALPGWDELQRLSPDERRRVLDYFRRLTEGARP